MRENLIQIKYIDMDTRSHFASLKKRKTKALKKRISMLNYRTNIFRIRLIIKLQVIFIQD